SVMATIPTQQVLSSAPKQLAAYDAQMCYAGYAWQWDQVSFQFLSPPIHLFQNENDNSCVLRIDTDKSSVLLTGDIEKTAEDYLIQNAGESLAADILIAPHHGSKTSSSAEFLARVNPDIILIPADTPNRFGFPHAEVIARYKKLAAKYYISGQTGAISIKLGKASRQLESYREVHGHYWNRQD
ncbi:MAG: DNA internalization-related competence protein ComEC/Rec2, partial [Gammaproteobacteria bacterium]